MLLLLSSYGKFACFASACGAKIGESECWFWWWDHMFFTLSDDGCANYREMDEQIAIGCMRWFAFILAHLLMIPDMHTNNANSLESASHILSTAHCQAAGIIDGLGIL